jgi:exonuclease III
VKLLALNVRHGGNERLPSILRYVAAQRPDVVVLAEWREKFNAVASAALHGMTIASLNDGASVNGLLVAARQPFRHASATPATGSAGVILLVEFDAFALAGSYFPQNEAKAAFFDALAGLARDATRPLLLLGDLNTGNQAADKEEKGAKFACAAQFDALSRESGLVDLWRRSNGDRREWTWRSSAGNGFRLDHAFADQRFIERFAPACAYDHVPRDSGLSDHSALIVTTSEARAIDHPVAN